MSESTIEQIRADIAELETQIKDKRAELRALRPVKAKAEPKECGCGCGDLTRGGDFLPGHDAKLRSRLLKAIDAGGPEGQSALELLIHTYPSLLHGATETELRERLGSEARKKEAAVERHAERERAKAKSQAKTPKARVDKTEAQQGTKSRSVARNGAAIRNAQRAA